MAQTGYSVLSIYNSSTPSAVPTAGNLVAGELAINTADGRLYYKDSAGVVQVIAGKGGAGVAGGSNTQVQYNSSGSLAGSANMVFDGSTLTTLNSAYTGTLTGGTGVVNLGSGQFYKDASGNVGIGTVPSAWGGSFKALQLGGNGAVWFPPTGTGTVFISNNTYFDGTNFKYLNTGAASYVANSSDGVFSWNQAASGTAGNNITFSERMRIDSSGNVGIGTSSPATKLSVATEARIFSATQSILSFGNAANTSYAKLEYDDTTGNFNLNNPRAFPLRFLTNDTERMRIDSSGNVLVGTTSVNNSCKQTLSFVTGSNGLSVITPDNINAVSFAIFTANGATCGAISRIGTTSAVVYTATSDYRLKTVIAPVADSGQRIDALQPIEYDWNTGGRTRGFLAHQFAEVYPNSVSGEKDAVDAEGKPVYQSMQASTSEVMADLIAEIQSLRKRVAQLESK